ncbi:hypothetical protein QJQ45_019231 [Haematococcus lacustris]|nr:hypothetical protein QJQ45_019231 [Haematococcus lacustris]
MFDGAMVVGRRGAMWLALIALTACVRYDLTKQSLHTEAGTSLQHESTSMGRERDAGSRGQADGAATLLERIQEEKRRKLGGPRTMLPGEDEEDLDERSFTRQDRGPIKDVDPSTAANRRAAQRAEHRRRTAIMDVSIVPSELAAAEEDYDEPEEGCLAPKLCLGLCQEPGACWQCGAVRLGLGLAQRSFRAVALPGLLQHSRPWRLVAEWVQEAMGWPGWLCVWLWLQQFLSGDIPLEPFHLKREREEGFFDAAGNYVRYRVDEVRDAWLDTLDQEEPLLRVEGELATRLLALTQAQHRAAAGTAGTGQGRKAAGAEGGVGSRKVATKKRGTALAGTKHKAEEEEEEEGEGDEEEEEEEEPAMGEEQMSLLKGRLAALLLPGENTLEGLRRLGRQPGQPAAPSPSPSRRLPAARQDPGLTGAVVDIDLASTDPTASGPGAASAPHQALGGGGGEGQSSSPPLGKTAERQRQRRLQRQAGQQQAEQQQAGQQQQQQQPPEAAPGEEGGVGVASQPLLSQPSLEGRGGGGGQERDGAQIGLFVHGTLSGVSSPGLKGGAGSRGVQHGGDRQAGSSPSGRGRRVAASGQGGRSRRLPSEQLAEFERMTECADLLLSAGEFGVYSKSRELLLREVAAANKAAAAKQLQCQPQPLPSPLQQGHKLQPQDGQGTKSQGQGHQGQDDLPEHQPEQQQQQQDLASKEEQAKQEQGTSQITTQATEQGRPGAAIDGGTDDADMFGEQFEVPDKALSALAPPTAAAPGAVEGAGSSTEATAAAAAAAATLASTSLAAEAGAAGVPPAQTTTAAVTDTAGDEAPAGCAPLTTAAQAGSSSSSGRLAAVSAMLAGFVQDEATGLHYSSSLGLWYDRAHELFMDANTASLQSSSSSCTSCWLPGVRLRLISRSTSCLQAVE